jgi:hypothetical protein
MVEHITLDQLLHNSDNDITTEKASYNALCNALIIKKRTIHTKEELDKMIHDRLYKELPSMIAEEYECGDHTTDMRLFNKTRIMVKNILNKCEFDRYPHITSITGRCEVYWTESWPEYDVLTIRPYSDELIAFAGTSLDKVKYGKYRFEVHMSYDAILHMDTPIKIPEDLVKWNHRVIR